MNCLNKRELEFLCLMIQENSYQPISYYAKKLAVSTKTLKTDLNEAK